MYPPQLPESQVGVGSGGSPAHAPAYFASAQSCGGTRPLTLFRILAGDGDGEGRATLSRIGSNG